jgi:N-formylglutamate amidohydrolase
MKKFDKIVLNIPHSSLNGVFHKEYGKWNYNSKFINNVLLEHTDLFTDFIFDYDKSDKVVSVISDLSRFVVDMERLDNDPLEEVGEGILYTTYKGFNRNELSDDAIAYLYKKRGEYYTNLYKELVEYGGISLLIDCHSFSSDIAKDIDVCVGYNEDSSKPDDDVIKHIVSMFEKAGYKVCINNPYSNSLTPYHSSKDDIMLCEYKSIMIEVNKRIYMNEYTHTINDNTTYAPKLTNVLHKLYESLLK